MLTANSPPQVEDVASVGTRISWGAILAGAMVALGMYFLLTTLAAAVGMSVSDRVDPTKLEIGAVIWTALMTTGALFVGGLVTSLFTAGENKTEAVLYGIIMWALLVVILMVLGSMGARTGFNAMAASAYSVHANAVPDNGNAENHRMMVEAATRLTWYAFFGTWISMFAAVAGALVGAGPSFRIVSVAPARREIMA